MSSSTSARTARDKNATVMISRYISEQEAFYSPTAKRLGIDNRATDSLVLANMRNVETKVFDVVRDYFDTPIGLSSFYRSVKLNKAVGGASTSQHLTGEAMDIDADIHGGITNREIFEYIEQHLDFDQLIWEFGNDNNPDWIHVSLKLNGTNRNQVLKAVRVGGKTKYIKL